MFYCLIQKKSSFVCFSLCHLFQDAENADGNSMKMYFQEEASPHVTVYTMIPLLDSVLIVNAAVLLPENMFS